MNLEQGNIFKEDINCRNCKRKIGKKKPITLKLRTFTDQNIMKMKNAAGRRYLKHVKLTKG